MSLDVMFDASFDESTSYPHLGFNPAPGLPADVEALENAITKATGSLQESGKLLDQMRTADSGVWVGAAADAFRANFNDKLVTDLQHAQQSLTEAAGTIQNWYKDLVGFKQTAQNLDQEAAAARQALQQAETQVAQAKSNPNLNLIGEVFSNPQALQQAQSALDQAESALNDANAAERQAQDDLDSILQRARQLQQEVDSAARNYASQLENATKGLAPHKPGWFSSMLHDIGSGLSAVGSWIEQHANAIHSILTTISGIAGLIALCTPPPIDAVAGAVALVAGAGALAMDFANPKTRDALGGLLTGHFTMANLKAAGGVAMDAVGVVPGIGALAKAAKGGEILEDGAKAAETIPTLASKIPGVAKLGANAVEDFTNAAENGGRLEQAFSVAAHKYTVVSATVNVINKVGTIGRDADSVINLSASTMRNINLGVKVSGVAHKLYSDVQEAF
ncbi:hypothetical protein KDK95_24335 [Actinospica sp. MGRD01-02]|uniref:WXG100 family type VII secretion target n=1 Tax=Actinospica acidithermotolerans TaxID=2828514 RepID=A0A941EDQ1_9ACTN|nr:hypothetical protein [Actinospica acidithermotolerans]MBR7829457.1 hypothetical protein [Actinospica acidithermotolerans]